VKPVGVYFSPQTRDYGAKEFISSYRGCLILLMQKHWEFQVVTPRTLADFSGDTLVLPDVREMGVDEQAGLKKLAASGKRIVITGQNVSGLQASENVVVLPDCPCRKYEAGLDANMENGDPERAGDFLAALGRKGEIEIAAPALVATSIAMVDGRVQIFLANFSGLRGGMNPVPTAQKGIVIRLRTGAKRVEFLPFLGDVQPIQAKRDGEEFVYSLPVVERGGVVLIEK